MKKFSSAKKINFVPITLMILTAMSKSIYACDSQKLTPLEAHFCQLKPKNSSLPDFHEFKKNTEAVQYLLLKGPARRAGVELPRPKPKTDARTFKKKPQTLSQPAQNLTTLPNKKTHVSGEHLELSNCSIQREVIHCNNEKFIYQKNLHNRMVSPSALSTNNKLRLPAYDASKGDSLSQYLAASYVQYVNKIVEIGLAQAVMSYTKFVTQYRQVTRNNKSFHLRMGRMFEILKQEKKSRPLTPVKEPELPKNLAQCQRLGNTLIVCDNVQYTWIFLR